MAQHCAVLMNNRMNTDRAETHTNPTEMQRSVPYKQVCASVEEGITDAVQADCLLPGTLVL